LLFLSEVSHSFLVAGRHPAYTPIWGNRPCLTPHEADVLPSAQCQQRQRVTGNVAVAVAVAGSWQLATEAVATATGS
jgi:hypothetical protein